MTVRKDQRPVCISHSVAETEAIAGKLAGRLSPGDCLTLQGDLGAGKTQFVRGLVRALGGDARRVCSPTFVLLNVYPTPPMTVYHLDAYRVRGDEDFEAIGFTELLDQRGLVVVEWPERIAGLLPRRRVSVRLDAPSPRVRRIEIDDLE